MGFTYLGPADGHDLPGLISLLRSAKEMREPVLIHVRTKKGYGYRFAEEDPAKFHGIGKFDPATGKKLAPKTKTFSDSFGEVMVEMAQNDPKVCAITAAMPGGTGLLNFMKQYPRRLFDVGIAEEHAVSMAGGLAKQGMIPVVALYSTFLQRAYDQMIQDVAMLGLHVVFAIDRAGLVGDDGPTHHGVFDVGFLRQIPGMRLLAPVSFAEQQDMLRWAVKDQEGPVAVRYPRGAEGSYQASDWLNCRETGYKVHRQGESVVFVTYGNMLDNVLSAADKLGSEGISAGVIRLLDLSGFNADSLAEQIPSGACVVVVEEVCSGSGIRETLAYELRRRMPDSRIQGLDLGADFVTHGNLAKLHELCGLDADSIYHFAKEMLSHES